MIRAARKKKSFKGKWTKKTHPLLTLLKVIDIFYWYACRCLGDIGCPYCIVGCGHCLKLGVLLSVFLKLRTEIKTKSLVQCTL